MGGGKANNTLKAVLELLDMAPEQENRAGTSPGTKIMPGTRKRMVSGIGTRIVSGKRLTSVSGKTPYFTISVSPASRKLSLGNSTTYSVTVKSENGFSRPVSLSTGSMPNDCKSSFSPSRVTPPPGGSSPSTLKVTASPKATPRIYDLIVTGIWRALFHAERVEFEVTK